MAKKAILDVLENTIGKYVLNLDAESLNVAVWSGKIELNSLQLDTKVVNAELARKAAEAPNLALPFRVIDGSFQSLKVEVPWARITSRPVVLRAKGLKVFVEPHNYSDKHTGSNGGVWKHGVSAENEKTGTPISDVNARSQSLELANDSRLRINAVRKLTALDDAGTAENGNGAGTASEAGSSFGGRLVRRIAENLQLEVDDVHVALRGGGCSAGVVLESLSLVTTDENGKRTFVDRSSGGKDIADSFLYKALQIKGLGVYLDEAAGSGTSSMLHIKSKNQSNLPGKIDQHSYILSPLSFEATLRQSDCAQCLDFPKYLISSELSQLSILLSKNQLELGNQIALAIKPRKGVARPLFPEYRPLTSVNKNNAKEWWEYAVRSIGRLNRQRSWAEFFAAFQKRKRYIPLYKRAVHEVNCPWMSPLTSQERVELDSIDSDRSISLEGIMMWRNIADALMEKEKEKHDAAESNRKNKAPVVPNKNTPRKSIMSSFFGSKNDSLVVSTSPRDDPPISLSLEEMKELEVNILEQASDSEVTKDSIFCDVSFTLSSFKVNLVSYGLRPIAALHMGTVASSFIANADGSFVFDFKLSSLQVDDRVTPKSLFPSILRSLQSLYSGDSSSFRHAFDFRLEKSRSGDQDLQLKIVAFEVVASPLVLTEVKSFFCLSKPSSQKDPLNEMNPMLTESVSGAVDLFYDAGQGSISVSEEEAPPWDSLATATAAVASPNPTMSDKLSSALTDAWNNKSQTKRTWTVDCKVHAPIIIVPENCTNPSSSVLIFDLGKLSFVLGKKDPSIQVVRWFETQPTKAGSDHDIDHCTLELTHLTFLIGKAGDVDWKTSPDAGIEELESRKSLAVIEPISLTLNVGIDSNTLVDGTSAQTCVFGVLPAISFLISPAHVSKMLSVYSTWKNVFETMRGNPDTLPPPPPPPLSGFQEEGISILDETKESVFDSNLNPFPSSPSGRSAMGVGRQSTQERKPSNETKGRTAPFLYVSIALRRLSAKILTDAGDSLEAHLVSVTVSKTLATDGSSSSRLCMGWFWILDMLDVDFPRRQRLVAHSNLPQAASSFVETGSYHLIMEDLKKQGVFEDGFSGSSDLADISSTRTPNRTDRESDKNLNGSDKTAISVIDAKFTSLFINWNPRAIKKLLLMKSNLIKFQSTRTESPVRQKKASGLRRSAPDQQSTGTIQSFSGGMSSPKRGGDRFTTTREFQTMTLIRAQMDCLEVALNSAKDDMPLFTLITSAAKVELRSSCDESMKASISVGDIRIETPGADRTERSYQTILGLAPNQSTSLLSIQYNRGLAAVQSCKIENLEKGSCEACAEVQLSPMRFVYVQAQVFTLIEYVSEGVLGAIAAQASSAASAAMESSSQLSDGDKLFFIKATGFDLVVPQSVCSPHHLVLHAGDLSVQYRSIANLGGSEIGLSLDNVSISCSRSEFMVDSPIRMLVDVVIRPNEVVSEEERATLVNVSISKAAFLINHNQYGQLMKTLEGNIGEEDSFLRDGDALVMKNLPSNNGDKQSDGTRITHSGVTEIVVLKRMYLFFKIDVLSLELCNQDSSDPIIFLAAVQTNITMRMMPDLQKMRSDVTLNNLICDDRRLKSMNRYFRSLICQVNGRSSADNQEVQDVFHLSYVKCHGDGSKDLDLRFGSPQLTVLPDAINDVLAFLKIDSDTAPTQENEVVHLEEKAKVGPEDVQLFVCNEEGDVEASFGTAGQMDLQQSVETQKMTVSISTADCRLVLVDMGTDSTISCDSARASRSSKSTVQLSETIVVQGKLEAQLQFTSDVVTGHSVGSAVEAHGERIEIYSAEGQELKSPVQILEPTKISSLVSTAITCGGRKKEIEVKLAALHPIELIISIQNVALMSAISTSLSESFAEGDPVKEESKHLLSEQETSQIEKLALALEEGVDGWESDGSSVGGKSEGLSSVQSSSRSVVVKDPNDSVLGQILSVKVTLPQTALTVINDLQGMDEALFRVVAENFVSKCDIDTPAMNRATEGRTKPTFEFHVNASFLADYFDSSSNLWKKLLAKPWEVTFNGSRMRNTRVVSKRLSTTFDIESHPCYISFSEQFLVSLGAASRMWSMYSVATQNAVGAAANLNENSSENQGGLSLAKKKSLASIAARSLITSLPYGLENHSGVMVYLSLQNEEGEEQKDRRPCPTGTTQYFQFSPRRGAGIGGRRNYGQDVTKLKTIAIHVGDSVINIQHLDDEIDQPRHAHHLGFGRFVFTKVVKSGKATILHLSSHIDVQNGTSIPFHISLQDDVEGLCDVGVCPGKGHKRKKRHGRKRPNLSDANSIVVSRDGKLSRSSTAFGIPIDKLHGLDPFTPREDDKPSVALVLSPRLHAGNNEEEGSLTGTVSLPPLHSLIRMATGSEQLEVIEVHCRSERNRDSLVVQVCCKVSLVDNCHPFIELFIQARCILENNMPVSLDIRTPMPYTFSPSVGFSKEPKEVTHRLEPFERVEVFTPGPTLSISVKCVDSQGGGATGWIEGDWVDLPLGRRRRLYEPIRCVFPFVRTGSEALGRPMGGGNEFFIIDAQAQDSLSEVNLESEKRAKMNEMAAASTKKLVPTSVVSSAEKLPHEQVPVLTLTVCNYAIDHTNTLLFEQISRFDRSHLRRSVSAMESRHQRHQSVQMVTEPFSVFSSPLFRHRVTLLPDSSVYIRLIQLAMDNDDGMRRTLPFRVEDIPMCDGGIESMALRWEDRSPSGHFAYLSLKSSFQSEIHIIPEFVIFNGSDKNKVLVRQAQSNEMSNEMILEPGRMAPIRGNPVQGLIVALNLLDVGGYTAPLRVDALGLRVCVVNNYAGSPIGSLAVQTVMGGKDSHLLIKIGELKYGGYGAHRQDFKSEKLFADDFFRFRIRWSEMQVTLNDTQQGNRNRGSVAVIESALDRAKAHEDTNKSSNRVSWMQARKEHDKRMSSCEDESCQMVAQILFYRFTVDYQRIFKDNAPASSKNTGAIHSPERAQLAVIIHNIRMLDLTGKSPSVVLDSSSDISFFDLCIRTRGSYDADLVKVDLFDLNLAYSDGKSHTIVLNTNEDFLWRLMDVANRIVVATAELAGVDLELDWDEENGGYIVTHAEFPKEEYYSRDDSDEAGLYQPPQSDRLYNIKTARVSPVTLLVSFKRQPQRSRYKHASGVRGAKLINYFSRRLKFTIDRAELRFAGYGTTNVRGPPDRLLEMITAVYSSRMKLKLVSLVKAVSFNDWKYLTAREGGDENYVEGDIIRLTGNLAGRSASYILKKVGEGLGDGVSNVTGTIGNGIQDATEVIGVGAVGAGINSVVTGLGDGVGTSVKGVGKGTGSILRGTVKGLGQIGGGVGGGVQLAAKGIGKGVMTGDGKAVVSGFGDGIASVGNGVGQGVETAVMGAADGVLSVGQGLFSGVKSVGKGFGGMFSGNPQKDPKRDHKKDDR